METSLPIQWLIVVISLGCIDAKSLNDTKTLINDLLVSHEKYARPVNSQDDTLNVTVGMLVKSIQEFDEVQERFSYVAGISLDWQDVGMSWDPGQYGGVDIVEVAWNEVWTPELILTNPAKEIKSFGQKWQRVGYLSNGHAYWVPGVLLETNCPVDARNYPFDTQICTTSIAAIGFSSDRVRINAYSQEVDLSIYSKNSAWSLLQTNIRAADEYGASKIDFRFYLKRKPEIIIINILLPILFLSLLNVLVFVLVPESGERVSFCITVVLAFAVFMTIVSETLPKSSEPVPIISYKLMFDMILSSLITVVTIFNLGNYNKSETEPKPKWSVSVYNRLHCHKKCKDGQIYHNTLDNVVPIENGGKAILAHNKMTQTDLEDIDSDDKRHDTILRSVSMSCECDKQITWKDISRLVDNVSLSMFSCLSVMSFVMFIVIVSTA